MSTRNSLHNINFQSYFSRLLFFPVARSFRCARACTDARMHFHTLLGVHAEFPILPKTYCSCRHRSPVLRGGGTHTPKRVWLACVASHRMVLQRLAFLHAVLFVALLATCASGAGGAGSTSARAVTGLLDSCARWHPVCQFIRDWVRSLYWL
jgi:hypothetical protein